MNERVSRALMAILEHEDTFIVGSLREQAVNALEAMGVDCEAIKANHPGLFDGGEE